MNVFRDRAKGLPTEGMGRGCMWAAWGREEAVTLPTFLVGAVIC